MGFGRLLVTAIIVVVSSAVAMRALPASIAERVPVRGSTPPITEITDSGEAERFLLSQNTYTGAPVKSVSCRGRFPRSIQCRATTVEKKRLVCGFAKVAPRFGHVRLACVREFARRA